MIGFLARTAGRAVVSAAVSAVVTLAVKEVAERRMRRKRPVPRLTDQSRKPAQKVKRAEIEAAE